MIYNKSGHPIEVKKISVRLWSLRDEIEAAIGRRMKECEAAGVPLFIDDIKRFYNLNLQAPLNEQSNVLQLHANKTDEAESMANLMESLNEETIPEAEVSTAALEGEAAPAPESKTFNQAEQLMAEQNKQGLETTKPNPILERPYQRQPPDLDKISYGFTLLSDIHMDNILIFNKDKFLQGQSVVVEFLIPQNFMMTATVTYCHYYALRSRIISSTKPDYRLQCSFSFAIMGERETLRSFLKSIEPTIPHGQKKMKKDSEDDSLGI
ncbi:MAG: hypothetical protein H0V66_15905 [Bdellovibrionales bacterium]|nr:hypothetical protein [Bdellovibrionales bacterium]